MTMLLMLAGVTGIAHPLILALTIFLMSAVIGAKLFSETEEPALAVRLGLLVGIGGAGTLGAIVVAAGSSEIFSRVAGVLVVALATTAAVGGMLLTHALLQGQATDKT
jgi:hypothetical protein